MEPRVAHKPQIQCVRKALVVPCTYSPPRRFFVLLVGRLSPHSAAASASRFNWSALLVLPIAFVFVSYLQHQKDLSDKALALGVVKDPKVL